MWWGVVCDDGSEGVATTTILRGDCYQGMIMSAAQCTTTATGHATATTIASAGKKAMLML